MNLPYQDHGMVRAKARSMAGRKEDKGLRPRSRTRPWRTQDKTMEDKIQNTKKRINQGARSKE